MDRSKKVSVVIPAFNEEQVIGSVVRQTIQVLESCQLDYELIVVDDGSTDGTSRVASQAGATVLCHPYNIGNGAAIKRGIRYATGDTVIFMDGDGQHDPNDIPRLLDYVSQYELVVGARTRESEGQLHRNLANRLYNFLASYIVGYKVLDLTSGFRAVNGDVAREIMGMFPNGYSYPSTCTIAVFRSGYSVKYVPIEAVARIGRSKIKLLRDGIGFLLILVRIGVVFTPLRIFLPIASSVFLPGFFYAIYKLFVGRPWTLPIVVSLTGGLLIFSLGLIAEQVALLRMHRAGYR